MIRKYSLVIEDDCDGYSAYVPELPAILVIGASVEELSSRSVRSHSYLVDNLLVDRSPNSLVREIEVELQV